MNTLMQLIRLAVGISLIVSASLFSLFAQSDTETDPKCIEAQTQMRHFFMNLKPELNLNLKYLEDLYYTCENPHERTQIIYYYIKSASLLKADGNYVEPPSDLFRYFYKQFQESAEAGPEVAKLDPEFGKMLETRTEQLEERLKLAESAANNPTIDASESSSSTRSLEVDPIFGAAAGTAAATSTSGEGTRSLGETEPNSEDADAPANKGFNYYPLPVKEYSASTTLPNRSFRKMNTLGEVDNMLQSVLNDYGYYSRDYFSVPDGFALVTNLEHTHPDGMSEDDWERWRTSVAQGKTFSLREYYMSLVFAEPGFYRSFAFVVTTKEAMADPDAAAGRLNDAAWGYSNGTRLPAQVGARPFDSNFRISVHVFEFEVPASEENARLVFSKDHGGNGLTAQQHLTAAKLWDELTK